MATPRPALRFGLLCDPLLALDNTQENCGRRRYDQKDARELGMRYIRMYMGSEDGAPGLTLYEIDNQGWVHRQVQIHANGSRFSPEDILMRRPVNTDYMALHPAAEEIQHEDFELLWNEVHDNRGFRERVPDPECGWEGWMDAATCLRELRWDPDQCLDEEDASWCRVPGFMQLFVRGDLKSAWATQRDLFLERPIHWRSLSRIAA